MGVVSPFYTDTDMLQSQAMYCYLFVTALSTISEDNCRVVGGVGVVTLVYTDTDMFLSQVVYCYVCHHTPNLVRTTAEW